MGVAALLLTSSDGRTVERTVQTVFKSLDLLIALLHVGDIIVIPDGRYGIVTKILGNTFHMMTVKDGKVQEVDVANMANEAKIDNSFDKTSAPYSPGRIVQHAQNHMEMPYIGTSLSFVRKCRNGM